jgi:hypothetical protein
MPQRTLSTRILFRFTSHLKRGQDEAAARVPTPISSSPPSKRWWPGETVQRCSSVFGLVYSRGCQPDLLRDNKGVGSSLLSFICVRLTSTVHIPTVSWDSGQPSDIFITLRWADYVFYLDPHHTQATIPPRPLTQTTERERGGKLRPRGDLCLHLAIIVRRHRLRPVAGAHRLFSYPTASPAPLSKQLSTSSPSSGGAHVRSKPPGANGGGSVLSRKASDADMGAAT